MILRMLKLKRSKKLYLCTINITQLKSMSKERPSNKHILIPLILGLFLFSSCRGKECKENRKTRINAMVTALTHTYTDQEAIVEYSEKSIDAIIDKYGCESLKKPNLPADQQKELLQKIDDENKDLVERLEKSRR